MDENAFAAVELDDPERKPIRMPFTAFFGAMAFPGMGHLLVGRMERGAIWFLVYLLALSLMALVVCFGASIEIVLALLGAETAVRLVEMADAVRCGRSPRWQYGSWWTRGLLVLGVFVACCFPVLGAIELLKYSLFEAYIIPTNSMSPTLIGESAWGTCTTCGKSVLLIPPDYMGHRRPIDDLAGICPHCGAQLDGRAFGSDTPEPHGKDRIIANKLLSPRRWEMVVFRLPEDSKTNYVKRLVGLPGERIELRDGKVTINGQAIEPPPDLKYLHYVDAGSIEPIFRGFKGWGDSGNPVTLGPDEYFMLGDFSARARDSRFWEQGAPGHMPYAVPADHIIGVVTHIYWPLDRRRTFERPE